MYVLNNRLNKVTFCNFFLVQYHPSKFIMLFYCLWCFFFFFLFFFFPDVGRRHHLRAALQVVSVQVVWFVLQDVPGREEGAGGRVVGGHPLHAVGRGGGGGGHRADIGELVGGWCHWLY